MSEHQITISLEVVATPDFFLVASPTSQQIDEGATAVFAISYAPVGSFAGVVNLTVSAVPDGCVAAFDTASIGVGQTANLSINTANITALGVYAIIIDGVSA